MGSDGAIYAGAGAVYLNNSGITIKGGKLTLQDSAGAHSGLIYVDTSGRLKLDAAAFNGGVQVSDLHATYSIYAESLVAYGGLYPPVKTTQPVDSAGNLVYDSSDGYMKYYSAHDKQWFRIQRTGGWD